jgi:catechol 2,3-dioxygenase-like lactoylglutathione lyase family enzyme
MIDHVSIAVRDLKKGEAFYTAALAPLGMTKLREWPGAAIGYGRKYPDFWINCREAMSRVAPDSGVHICLRAADTAAVDAFHAAALKAGGASDGAARRISRQLLRGFHPRSRWQSHRGGDVFAGCASVAPTSFLPAPPSASRLR